ncbi:MAG: MBL fold metallo-hydrolase [Pseudomonadales bacterium]
MRKAVYFLVAIAIIVAAAFAYIFNSASGQDAAFKRAATMVMGRTSDTFDGLRVVVCGSASPLGNAMDRAQACIAVVTPEHFFLFDVGARSPLRINQAQLPLGRLTGVFFTHYHSDHIAGLPDVNLASWVRGRPGPLKVYGAAGIDSVVQGFNTAYQLDRSYRTAHHGAAMLPPDRGAMQAHTIAPNTVVWQDDSLSITAFKVAHPPIEPAVGYRVDYKGRSVVISGDTNAADSLFTAAKDADLLFHDALSRTLLDPMIDVATTAGAKRGAKIMTDVIDYHADSTTLSAPAAAAGIRQLVFYHMVPVPTNALAAKMFLRDLPEDIILAEDLHTFDLPPESSDIIVHAP